MKDIEPLLEDLALQLDCIRDFIWRTEGENWDSFCLAVSRVYHAIMPRYVKFDATKDQIARVVLEHGTSGQQKEAIDYIGGRLKHDWPEPMEEEST